MKIFAMSDLHLSEASGKPMDVFGPRWENHTERIKENWDKTLREEDVMIISGDVSWGLKLEEAMPDFQWIHERPGIKLITKGNHDLWWSSPAKLNVLFDDMVFIQNGCAVVGETAVCGTRGWMLKQDRPEWTEHDEKIHNREQIRMKMALDAAVSSGASRIILSLHYPPTDHYGSDTAFTELIRQYPVSYVVYGHLHGEDAVLHAYNGRKDGVTYRLVSSDYVGFQPQQIFGEKEDIDESAFP